MAALPGVRVGLTRGATYGLLEPAERFMPAARALGARLIRVNLYWSQIEPRPGRFTWDTVDALLDQLGTGEEVWVTVCSSSPWATERPTRFLPSSPAVNLDDYRRFVEELVRHCDGAVRYWQCENEPCVPLLWSGGPEEYLSQLIVFADTVRRSSPGSLVVLGGAVPAAMFAEEAGGDARWSGYLEKVVRGGGDHFDLFDVHPYGDPYVIPALVKACEALMTAYGTAKPVVAGEYNGPMPTSFDQNLPYLGDVIADHRRVFLGQTALADGGLDFDRETSTVTRLYRRVDELPSTLRMFMAGRSAALAEEHDRLAREDLVIRTVLLLSSGVGRAACFQLAPEARDTGSSHNVRSLMFDSFALMDYDGDTIGRRRPAADTFALLSATLADARAVRRLESPGLHLFEIDRETRDPAYVAWRRGEGTAHVTCPWRSLEPPRAVSALGEEIAAQGGEGLVRVPVSTTPVIVT